MKKIHLIVQTKDQESALEKIRALGVLHVVSDGSVTGELLAQAREKKHLLEQVVSLLKNARETYAGEKSEAKKGRVAIENNDVMKQAQEILDLFQALSAGEEEMSRRSRLIDYWRIWGDFNLKDVATFKEKELFLSLCEVDISKEETLPEGILLFPIGEAGGVQRCLAVSRQDEALPFKTIPWPEESLSSLEEKQGQSVEKNEKLLSQIKDRFCLIPGFERALNESREVVTFEEVAHGMQRDEALSLLKGFCPEEVCPSLQEEARRQHWGLLVEDPSEEDAVPTLLRNPKWVEMINPVLNLAGIVPGYEEVDVSPVFLLFFSLFFGILIGDAGYGFLFLVATMWAQKKTGHKVPSKTPFFLMYVLSGATIVWGILTGVYFGQEWVSGLIKPLAPWLNELQNIQMLCFLIGAVHLSLAHAWRALKRYPDITFLSEAGWACVIWGMYDVARVLILGMTFPARAKAFFLVGVTAVVFFTKPNKNPLKAIGPGLAELAMNIVNSFSDIVSYIRLFAVGMASVAVADAFNSIALGIGFGNVLTGFVTALILVVGHVFNIILGAMSILVHGLRLNLLEFSGHMGLSWSGFKYDPFKRSVKSEQRTKSN